MIDQCEAAEVRLTIKQFGKGNTTTYNRAQYHDVSDTQGTFHTYTVDWNKDRIEWLIDGSVVRTLTYSDSLTLGGQNYPQTPMRLKVRPAFTPPSLKVH